MASTIRTKKLPASLSVKSYKVPDEIDTLIIRNSGASPIAIWFNANEQAEAYIIGAGDSLPSIPVSSNTLYYQSLILVSELSLMMWEN